MKITKKLLCAALSLIMVVSCFATAVMADEATGTRFSDVTSDQLYANAVNTLSLMGIINGYEDGTFKPDQNVTRAEFSAMLMRTLKLGHLGDKSAAGLPFSDIDDNNSDINWAIPNINTCYSMGIINGYDDGTFKPSANVAFEEAVKMIICTLGYGTDADVSKSPWYVDYMDAATRTGIVKVASRLGAAGTPATRACIAQLLYDSLEVGLIESGMITEKTILSDYLGYRKCTGIIASNGTTSLTSPDVNLRDDEIQIYAYEEDTKQYETHTYTTTDETLKDRLGYEIEFYYASDGSSLRTLMISVLQESKTLTINAANIEPSDTTETVIEYYEDRDADRTKRASLEVENVVIYNSKLYGSNEYASRFDTSMIPDVGSITLIDSDNDSKYDIVNIEAYKLYYVSSRSTSTYEIVDNVLSDASKNKIILNKDNDKNLTIVNESGNDVNFSSIAVNNIVALAESNNNGGVVVRKAVVLNDKVTGTVTASNSNSITIGGKTYFYSNAAPWMNNVAAVEQLERPSNQDSGNFYLDMNGDIVAYSKDATSENTKYGFIRNHSRASAIDDEVVFEVVTSNGSVQIGTYPNTKVDGNTCETGQEVVDALYPTAIAGSSKVQQLIKFSTRTSGGKTVFDKIYTADDVNQGQKVEPDSLTRLSTIDNGMKMRYNSTSKKLTEMIGESAGSESININNAMVMCVPDDLEDYSEFRKSSVSNEFRNGKDYYVEVYDVSATGIPEVVVLYGADSSEEVHSLSPVYVFEDKEEAENPSEDNDVMTKISGYMVSPSSSGGSFSEWISEDSSSIGDTLQIGDIFRAGADRDGYMLVKNENVIYRAGETVTFGIEQDSVNVDMVDAEYVIIKGGVAAKDTNNVSIAVNNSYSDTIPFSISDFDRAKILVYSYDNDNDIEITDASGDYEAIITGLSDYNTGSTPDEVIIYMSDGEIKLLVVLPAQI